nr:MAG TPA: hypothetical protein [Caudoviricetes sp.]
MLFFRSLSPPYLISVERFGFPLARGFRFSAACPRLTF